MLTVLGGLAEGVRLGRTRGNLVNLSRSIRVGRHVTGGGNIEGATPCQIFKRKKDRLKDRNLYGKNFPQKRDARRHFTKSQRRRHRCAGVSDSSGL